MTAARCTLPALTANEAAAPIAAATTRTHVTMDIWGYCSGCDHWFRCPDWFDRDAPQPCCDVCGREPTAIENRAADGGLVLVD